MDGVLVVSAQSARRLERLGVRRDRIYEVRNTPCLGPAGDGNNDVPGHLHSTGGLTLTYTGGLEETRGLAVVFEALAKVVAHEPRVKLVVAGSGPSEGMCDSPIDRCATRFCASGVRGGTRPFGGSISDQQTL